MAIVLQERHKSHDLKEASSHFDAHACNMYTRRQVVEPLII